jgi:hypothetical protein
MKPFTGFKSEAKSNKIGSLPIGVYVAVIKGAKVTGSEPDQQLEIALDVSEGEFSGFYMKKYESDKQRSKGQYDVRYKGVFRLRIPNPDNKAALYPESDIRNFNDAIYKIEVSNPGYTWDWNEAGLVGKTVGINMQEREYNGNTFTRVGRLENADDVRKGIVSPMKSRNASEGAKNAVDEASGMAKVETVELPWKQDPDTPWF